MLRMHSSYISLDYFCLAQKLVGFVSNAWYVDLLEVIVCTLGIMLMFLVTSLLVLQ